MSWSVGEIGSSMPDDEFWEGFRDELGDANTEELKQFFTDYETFKKYMSTEPLAEAWGEYVSDWKNRDAAHWIAKPLEWAYLSAIEPGITTVSSGADVVSTLINSAVGGLYGGAKIAVGYAVAAQIANGLGIMGILARPAAGHLSGSPLTQWASPMLMDFADWAEKDSVGKWADKLIAEGEADMDKAWDAANFWSESEEDRQAIADAWEIAWVSNAMLLDGASLEEVKRWNDEEHKKRDLYEQQIPEMHTLLFGKRGAVSGGVWRVSSDVIEAEGLTPEQIRAEELDANTSLLLIQGDTMSPDQMSAILDATMFDDPALWEEAQRQAARAFNMGVPLEEIYVPWEKPDGWELGDYVPEWVSAEEYQAYLEQDKLRETRPDSAGGLNMPETQVTPIEEIVDYNAANIDGSIADQRVDEFYGSYFETWNDTVEDVQDWLDETPWNVDSFLSDPDAPGTRENAEGIVVSKETFVDNDQLLYNNIVRDEDGRIIEFTLAGNVGDNDVSVFTADMDDDGNITGWSSDAKSVGDDV